MCRARTLAARWLAGFRRKRLIGRWSILALIALGALVGLLVRELSTAQLQSLLISRYAAAIEYWLDDGPNPTPRFPDDGPYDRRLGYSELPERLTRLRENGFEVTAQARASARFYEALDRGLFPIYDEKSQAGLKILSQERAVLFANQYPTGIFPGFDAVPELLIRTLLYLEDRELLDAEHPYANPAVEWDRLGLAAIRYAQRLLGSDNAVPGASTLVTQMEKFRHSQYGITSSPKEKLRQMASASVRTYRGGRTTSEARRRIVVDYLNGLPLGAIAGHGEVHGLLDGLMLWYGIHADELSVLREPLEVANLALASRVYRAALSLILASRRPTFYLGQAKGHESLSELANIHVRLLGSERVIPAELASAAVGIDMQPHFAAPLPRQRSFVKHKAENLIRAELLNLLGIESLYDLDRLDLTVATSIDRVMQDIVTKELRRLADADYRATAGLAGSRLLPAQGAVAVSFSFLLCEATPDGNRVRVQTDSFEGPRDVNQNTRLEFGSTAKLRTLVSYLEIIETLYTELSNLTPEGRLAYLRRHDDLLTEWMGRLLEREPEVDLPGALTAGMKRGYSASPAERFFTASGLHSFANFDRRFDGSVLTVEQGFVHSVNLVFIRLMRDLVRYHIARFAFATEMLTDHANPLRTEYLARFADQEGRVFMMRFHGRHFGRAPLESIDSMVKDRAPSVVALGRIYRAVLPDASLDAFSAYLADRLANGQLSATELETLYRRVSPEGMHLADLGYLTGMHPLELSVVRHLSVNPEASLATTLLAGTRARQEAYRWLFGTRRASLQDERIRIVLEADAFAIIHRGWQRLGYPFASLVPSYATAIGSSGDSPYALAELIGILVNDGVRRPLAHIEDMRFAEQTPFETHLRSIPARGERVLSPDVVHALRAALAQVIESGTGRRLHRVFQSSQGAPLLVGGKTGTGDNRFEIASSGVSLARNRTAALVFFVESHFGVVTAYVEGEQADDYTFTSALPAQILRHLAPALAPLFSDEDPRRGVELS